jgi:putative tryptophan/tyrosine transport system substrate-binding protein
MTMTGRREVLTLAVATWPAWVTPTMAQESGQLRRVAYLGTSTASQHLVDAFTRSLPQHGWVVGKNLVIDARFTEGDPARVAPLTHALLAQKPDVFVSATDVYARDAAAAPSAVPIVFVLGFDPIGVGLVKTLAAPGGRCTGFSVLNWELNPKRLALLKEAVPRLGKVGLLYREGDPNAKAALEITERAGRELRLDVLRAPVKYSEDFAAAFKRLVQQGAKGVLNVPDSLFFRWRQQLADLAIEHRLAAMFGATEYADAGMLLAYGTDFKDVFVRAAGLVGRILKGAVPAGIPVEQANTYELVVNQRTARSLGIELPRSLLLQASRVIEAS